MVGQSFWFMKKYLLAMVTLVVGVSKEWTCICVRCTWCLGDRFILMQHPSFGDSGRPRHCPVIQADDTPSPLDQEWLRASGLYSAHLSLHGPCGRAGAC